MSYTKASLTVFALTSFIAGCATPLADSLTLSQGAIDSAVLVAPPHSKSRPIIAETYSTHTIPYNLGIKHRSEAIQSSTTLPNGLIETVFRASAVGPIQSTAGTRTLTLCGLVPLILEQASPGSLGSLAFIGKAGTAIPVGASAPSSNRELATSFETSSRDLCKPEDGLSFQFVTAMKVEQNLPPFRKVDDLVETSKCLASPIPEKYEKLKVAGASLFLTCSVTGGNLVRPKEKLYVYFPDLVQYFPVLLKFSDINYIEIDYTKAPKASQ